MQSAAEGYYVVRIDLKNGKSLDRARLALRARRTDFGRRVTFAWYPKVCTLVCT